MVLFVANLKRTRITVRGRCAQRSGRSQIVPIHEIQGYSLNLSHHSSNPIHVDPRILFCQQMFMFCRQLLNYFKTLGKSSVIDDFWKYLVFSTRSWTSSHVTWRHRSSGDQLKCDSYPWNFFLIKKWKKFKKGAQNVSKRWSKTMPMLPANPFQASLFFNFWNSLTNQELKNPISSGRVPECFCHPVKVITHSQPRPEPEEEASYFARTNDRALRAKKSRTIQWNAWNCPLKSGTSS